MRIKTRRSVTLTDKKYTLIQMKNRPNPLAKLLRMNGMIVLFLVLLMSCQSSRKRSTAEAPPNVILIFIDDMGYGDLSIFGNDQVATPHIDALASEGLRMTQFYVNSPICSPSRVAITTGQYPLRYGINSYFASRQQNSQRDMPDFLPARAPALARILRGNGYATGHFGKWHMGGGRDVDDAPHPAAFGFDRSLVAFEGLGNRVLEPGDNNLQTSSAKLGQGHITYAQKYERTGIYVDTALAFISAHRDQPFYVNLWPNDVHDRHIPEPGSAEKFAGITDNPYEQEFFAVLTAMDREIGRFLNELDKMNLLDNTLIILTSDNGPTDWPRYYQPKNYPENYTGAMYPPGSTGGFHGRKWSLYEGGIRMPFIVFWKDHIRPGRVDSTSTTAAMDLLPTICRITHTELPSSYQSDGQDISRIWLEGPRKRSDDLHWFYLNSLKPGNPNFVAPELAIRSGDWKLLTEVDGSKVSLFNLAEDPFEQRDLSTAQPAKVSELKARVLKWYEDTKEGNR